MNEHIVNYQAVIDFWFSELEPAAWFKKDISLDKLIGDRFLATYYAAGRCELFGWRKTAQGRLAEIIVLDQFSRNMFRDDPRAFQYDSLAVALTQEAVAGNYDEQLTPEKKQFLYMPLMHSESLTIHRQAEALFAQPGLENNYDFEIKHKAIIEQFGRYPHRNDILGRQSTEQEVAFLKQPGSSF
ncbi:DUF924 family protein [Aliikangiella maris]|uniref:DUF924 family protein n=2 Tax=Aliikangiella maris TaxID=3162458 RepID=A0ABV3MR47_9GAMM